MLTKFEFIHTWILNSLDGKTLDEIENVYKLEGNETESMIDQLIKDNYVIEVKSSKIKRSKSTVVPISKPFNSRREETDKYGNEFSINNFKLTVEGKSFYKSELLKQSLDNKTISRSNMAIFIAVLALVTALYSAIFK